jgi:carbonic anhydrase/acetyltransferase-like protein (isoleucine patch superfamily)
MINSFAVQPSCRAIKYKNKLPNTNGAFVASSATVLGDVKIGSKSSVWYGAVLRGCCFLYFQGIPVTYLFYLGDSNRITIGDATSVGDNVMIHADGPPRESPAVIGNKVVIGAGATIHGAILEDESFVGDNATVLDLAVIRKNGMLAPGALLAGGKEIKSGELWAGVPAKFERKLTSAEIDRMVAKAQEAAELADVHRADSAKTWQELYDEREDYYERVNRESYYRQRLTKEVG